MKDKSVENLIRELHKVEGVTHVLPFNDILVIDFNKSRVLNGFNEEEFTSGIKKVIHSYGLKMLTEKTTNSKKIINLIA